MNRFVSALLGCAVVINLVSSSASAGGTLQSHAQRQMQAICAGYHKNVLWPWPDICPDRAHARMPFDIMVNNGWRRQNLLGSHHFDEETGELTTAGELKVHWVMTQAPEDHRQIFVERTLNSEIMARRLAAAEKYAELVALQGQTPSVQDTHLISEGRPAAIVDAINVSFQESMPPPVLKPATLSGGSQ